MNNAPHLMALVTIIGVTMTSRAAAPGGLIAHDPAPAVKAVNALGLELLAQAPTGAGNALLSPFSIQSALAMTFAGAEGRTREEMARVLHYPNDANELHGAFLGLRHALDEIAKATAKRAEEAKKQGRQTDPITLTVANRLFGQHGYDFREPFLTLASDVYDAPFQALDFAANASGARTQINAWVVEKTRQRIRDLIPPDGLDRDTRLVLVNAIYMKAPWAAPFLAGATQPRPFHVRGGQAVDVPTMRRQDRFGHAKREGFSVITVPYLGGELQFLILLPDEIDGLAADEARLTPEVLEEIARPGTAELILYLPKFKLEPPLLRLGELLQALGMESAFDKPPGSANFEGIAPRRPNDYLFISEIFHKTFLELDEKGTEAAAATAVTMARPASAAIEKSKPIEVRVDRPFLFAVQHRSSGACLFLGRVSDPR